VVARELLCHCKGVANGCQVVVVFFVVNSGLWVVTRTLVGGCDSLPLCLFVVAMSKHLYMLSVWL